jgi:hypothetical protein
MADDDPLRGTGSLQFIRPIPASQWAHNAMQLVRRTLLTGLYGAARQADLDRRIWAALQRHGFAVASVRLREDLANDPMAPYAVVAQIEDENQNHHSIVSQFGVPSTFIRTGDNVSFQPQNEVDEEKRDDHEERERQVIRDAGRSMSSAVMWYPKEIAKQEAIELQGSTAAQDVSVLLDLAESLGLKARIRITVDKPGSEK